MFINIQEMFTGTLRFAIFDKDKMSGSKRMHFIIQKWQMSLERVIY